MNNVNPVLASANQSISNTSTHQATEALTTNKENSSAVQAQNTKVTLSTSVRDAHLDYMELDPQKIVTAKPKAESEVINNQKNIPTAKSSMVE